MQVLQLYSSFQNTQKVIGVDWSKLNPNLVCFVSYDGVLVAWDINFNSSKKTPLGKLTATCLTCCPHDEKIVAVGSKVGLIYIVNVNKSEIMYKLRGHDQEIVSLSWCPVPFNVFQTKNSKDFLLASGAKDKYVFYHFYCVCNVFKKFIYFLINILSPLKLNLLLELFYLIFYLHF